MSHELRTPLNAIIGFSQLLQSEPLGPLGNERYREYAGDIQDSGTHLLSLINDVLDFSKADAGRLDLQEEELDARHVLDECLRLVAPEAQEAGIAVVTEMQETAPTLLADRRRVKQIALNLLSNALKFTPSGGTLRVKLACDAEGLEISVADNGIGMSPEQIPIALAPFGQVDSRLSRQHEGTGLGLPLCRRFAEAHGGSLTIASALGEGTTVTVRFPLERVKSSRAA
jgi:signal transduction histidine kinase